MEKRTILILGDILVLGIITLIGFAAHSEINITSLSRMLTTFLPLLAGWFLSAPRLGLFETQKTAFSFLWRVPFAILLAAPLTAILRAVMLNSSALPLFTLILGGSSMIGLLIWRAFWEWKNRLKGANST
jgi:hypothetical protein